MQQTKKKTGYVVGIVLVLLAIAFVVGYGLYLQHRPQKAAAAESPEPSALVLDANAHGVTQEVDTVSFEAVQDGLRDMGFLITEDYYFTEVVTREKSRELLKTGITIPFTESSYVASYDGEVHAGVDFSKITVSVDAEDSTPHITIRVPEPEIQSVSIDHDSFVLYSEKTGIGNPFSAEEYNESLTGLEEVVREKAIDKGILKAAGENAKQQIKTFVESVCAGKSYTLDVVVK